MKLFDKFKRFIACTILIAFVPSQAWAQGITIPTGSSLSLNTGTLAVPENIINNGTLNVTTGNINIEGNWTNSGTFNAGTSTVTFNAPSGTQTLNSGGAASTDAFYKLTHSGAGTVQLATSPILINNNFTNSLGTFNASNLNMTIDGNWDNAATFTPGTDLVTLGGSSQSVLGTTTFYDFSKIVSTAATLTFDHLGTQTFTDSLTMQGAAGQPLTINSDSAGHAAAITLNTGGAQSINTVNVQDSNASGGLELLGRGTSTNISNNTNWEFGVATITWVGGASGHTTDWNYPTNWDIGAVPAAGDTVKIPGGTTYEPVLTTNVTIGNLTVGSSASAPTAATASLTLSGYNLTVSTAFANNGTVLLEGNEVLTLTMDSTHGTFTYVGLGGSSSVTHTLTINGSTNVAYNNLVINDPNATPSHRDVFSTSGTLTINGNLTVTSGTLNATTSSNSITADGSVTIGASGILDAPTSTLSTAFTVKGSWTNNGTFNADSGLVTFNGTGQSLIGSTTFYQFNKTVAAADTLTFDHTGTQTFTNSLTLMGASGQALSIRSDLMGTQADIILSAGGLQLLNYLDVEDSNAGTPPADVMLAPNNSHDSGHNTNWIFGGTTITWKGGTVGNLTDWNTASNWDLGFVPRSTDTVAIPNVTNEPVLSTTVTVANLTINTSASLTLNSFGLTVSSTFTNKGNFILEGTEALALTQDTSSSDGGTFTYVGDGSGNPITIKDFGANDYYNLTINDTHSGASSPNLVDTYTISTNALHALGTLTVTKSSLTLLNGTAEVDGGVTIASGATLIAPSATTNTAFLVGGTWNNSGTFTSSGGKVTLDGTGQSILGSTTFAYLRKVITSADTLTLDTTGTQTVTTDLTLTGAANPNRLSLVSTVSGTAANLYLLAGGTQTISDLSVKDSNAGGVPADVTLIDRNDFVNVSNNTNWQFGAATLTWKGGTTGNLTDWSTASNWDLGQVPVAGDTVNIPGGTTYEPVLSAVVTVGNLTVGSSGTPATAATATLTLNGNNLTVSTAFANNGNVILEGNEVLTLTMDSTHGTFTYVGQGGSSSVTHTLTVNGSPNVAFNNLVIDDPNAVAAHRDIFATNGTLTVNGNLTVTSGTLDASSVSSSIADTGSVTIGTNGIFKAPPGTSNTAFTVGGNWTNNGTFNNSSGNVTFIPAATVTITGNTTFYDFTSKTPGKTILFDPGVSPVVYTQTVSNTFNVSGLIGSLINLESKTPGTQWNISFPNGTQSVGELYVQDSIASHNNITCLNCNPGESTPNTTANDNTSWIFDTLTINSPSTGSTIGQTPTIIGTAPASNLPATKVIVYIRDASGTLVSTAISDSNGNFRAVVGQDGASTGLLSTPPPTLALGSGDSLTPYLSTAITAPGGTVTGLTVVTSPTTTNVPLISTLNGNPVTVGVTQNVTGGTLIITGQGVINGATVTVQALDANGNLLLSAASSGTTDINGNFSVSLATNTIKAANFLSVTVQKSGNETTSALVQISLTDPYGYVYNSISNEPIQGATVTLYSATTKQAATGVMSCNMQGTCTSANPFTTGADGYYSFLAINGDQYYIGVSAGGYTFPSTQTTVPSGRTVGNGSKGQTFTVGSQVFEIDLPLDGNGSLLRITKTANKSEASVGDIVMYTVNIQNLSSGVVDSVYLNDKIPPGFKYIKDRVILNGSPISDPSGERPILFNVGNIPVGATQILQYQLVIGSGVTMGTYNNTANAQFTNGEVISNPAQASVKIIPDPVFDLGTVIGKVFFDWNENGVQDPPYYDSISHETIVEKPVPNVQIVMEDGTIITTDKEGKFSIPGLLPGRHLFRVDERTLPPGAYMTTDKTVIADITAGSISKVNFGVNIDQTQVSGRDAVYFNEKLRLTQDRNRPVPRLNAALFDASANAVPNTEEVLMHDGIFVRQAEFRIFTNYSPFITSWRLDILDADTKKVIRSFTGTPLNINDPIYWNGKDDHDAFISPDHKYSYVLTVSDSKYNNDDTKENPITIRDIKDDISLKKEQADDKGTLKDRADRYSKWLNAEAAVNNLNHQLIQVKGETIHIDRQGTDVRSIRVMKGNKLFMDLPLSERYGLTPQEEMAGGASTADEKDNLEIILPNGDYTLDVLSAKAPGDSTEQAAPAAVPQSVPSSGPSRTISTSPGALEHYSRPLKVGDDYLMFVALGDAESGYNIDRGNIEPIQDKTEEPGFYSEGKGAYYLKGQILGKYLITSSFDTDRQEKAMFRSLDPNTYYPVYGDQSSINYDATDTKGPLYLKVEWDKSTAILGNYAIDFNDTEFAAFSRSYYGGKIDYQSVSNNPYGDARTKIVVYHADIQQLPSHNEFLATGGSLYFLKYMNVVQGTDVVTIQVRDETTGLVIASQTMTNGADYELDNSQGRILFWQPVAMIAQSESIISNSLVNGDPIYVVVDYQYEVTGLITQGSQGARLAQAVGDNLVLGGTYVQENSNGQNFTLSGTDATLHVTKDATIKAEYAQTTSQETGSYVSTDGGITFTSLALSGDTPTSGQAYGIKGDARLFDNIGLKSYFKWIGNNFATPDTSSQQGKESAGMSMTWDMSPVTRLTASEDIQKLMAQNNLQTTAQVGASETDTTMVQVVHTAEKLKLTGQFQMTEVKSVVDGITSTTNQKGATMAGQAQYDLTPRIKLTLGQQVDVTNKDNTATTLGAADRVTDNTSLNVQETMGQLGHALTAGLTNQLNKRIALTTAYTLTNLDTGEVDKTASVGVEAQATKNLTTTSTVAMTGSSNGTNTTSASIGAKARLSDSMTMDMSVGKSQSSTGAQGGTTLNLNGTTQIGNTTVTATAQGTGGANLSNAGSVGIGTTGVLGAPAVVGAPSVTSTMTTSLGLQATTKVDSNTTTNGSVNVGTDDTGSKTTTYGFGNTSQLDKELQAVTANSFSFSPANGTTDSSKYGLVRNVNGAKSEADFTQAAGDQPGTVTQSNIFGLSGDVNDKLALNGSIERGKVQNLDVSQTNRTDFTLGAGYVLKDTETAVERLKDSVKLEYRVDKGIGTDSLSQYVVYDAIDGRITDNWSMNAKVDYSKTMDTTSGATAERHQEIIFGMAYRPVNFDNLNLIGEYSYQDGYGGGLQQADALNTNVDETVAQVFSAEGVYDINNQWQLDEKAALRIESEQDTGFAFTQTHTWLVIHRLNYKIDRNWTISGEYRDLVQVEAKDNKQGLLLEATRELNSNTELAFGWNFTDYTDDLTNLSYTAQGPYIRMTGKFYDETPEERARARAKWLDAKINEWAWELIRKEFSKKDSKIVLELNRMFYLARKAEKAGRLDESHQIYKDIIAAGQMMYDEAFEYIRGRIAFEQQLEDLYKTGRDYFKGGEYLKARKIWEKVVEDASKRVVK